MTWPKDFLDSLERKSTPVITSLPPDFCRSPMMTEADYEDRIAELEAQVTRLQIVARAVERNGEYNDMHDEVWDAIDRLHPTDLDPIEQGHGDHS